MGQPKKPQNERQEKHTSTLAVDKDIAQQVKEVAQIAGATTFEVTNQLLKFALSQGKIELEIKTVVVEPRRAIAGKSKT